VERVQGLFINKHAAVGGGIPIFDWLPLDGKGKALAAKHQALPVLKQ